MGVRLQAAGTEKELPGSVFRKKTKEPCSRMTAGLFFR